MTKATPASLKRQVRNNLNDLVAAIIDCHDTRARMLEANTRELIACMPAKMQDEELHWLERALCTRPRA